MPITRCAVVIAGALAILSIGCREQSDETRPKGPLSPAERDDKTSVVVAPRSSEISFVDQTESAGIGFRHFDPATPSHLIHETMGSGVAWIDYDVDGWPDLLCVQGGPVPPAVTQEALTHRLYRNLGNGRFSDVTARVGLGESRVGMGAAVGDFDNDGFDDLALTWLGGVSLLRNIAGGSIADGSGGRRFADITETCGVKGTNPHWATSCAWGDLDNDGWLDLYVCNYVETDERQPLICRDPATGVAHACPPTAYPVTQHRLYRNLAGAAFENVTESSGVGAVPSAAGLAVTIVDFDADGRSDIYVANDMFPAHLFHNQTEPGGPIKLVERAGLAGCGLGPNGSSMSGMCVEVGDVDGSGRPSIFVTNFQSQPNVLFVNLGQLQFRESAAMSGLGGPSRTKLGFGAAFLDADLDGILDVAVANGHVYRSAPELLGIPYAQETQVFRGRGNGTFRDVSSAAGGAIQRPRVGRGVARADYDRDGRPDLVMSAVGGPVTLLRNVTNTNRRWLGIALAGNGASSNRSAIGSVIRVESAGETAVHFVSGGGSYLSAHERVVVIGVADVDRVDRVTVRWPSGDEQAFSSLATDSYWRLCEGDEVPDRLVK